MKRKKIPVPKQLVLRREVFAVLTSCKLTDVRGAGGSEEIETVSLRAPLP